MLISTYICAYITDEACLFFKFLTKLLHATSPRCAGDLCRLDLTDITDQFACRLGNHGLDELAVVCMEPMRAERHKPGSFHVQVEVSYGPPAHTCASASVQALLLFCPSLRQRTWMRHKPRHMGSCSRVGSVLLEGSALSGGACRVACSNSSRASGTDRK